VRQVAGETKDGAAGDCLGHLKVLELCNLVAGPYCAKLLADLGAEVIKVEPPGVGDAARRRGPFLGDDPHPEKSGLFLYLNMNKLGVTLDVTSEAGRSVFKDLVRQSDVLVEDNAPAVMEDLGLTYNDLRKLNDRLVMVSITPFGQTGPYRDFRAYELNCFHAGGEGYLLPIESDRSDREPVRGGGLEADCVCGLGAALGGLAAVYRMQATGMGQHVDVAKQDVLMAMVGLDMCVYTSSSTVRTRHSRGSILPTPVKCKDGYIMITPWPDPPWQAFARIVGNTAWIEDERYSGVVKRREQAKEINHVVGEWALQYEKEDLFHRLQENGVAAAPVNTAADIAESSQMKTRGFFSEIDRPIAGNLSYPFAPYGFSGTPCRLRRPAPLLGQHNEMVFRGRLGYGAADLTAMAGAGVI
jgi:CoA:oxalate CoA-transferase